MKKKFNNRIKGLNGLLFAIIGFMCLSPFGLAFAGIFALGMAALPFMPLPSGILGDNAPVMSDEDKAKAAETALLEKIKSNMAVDFKKLIEDNVELKAVKDISEKMKTATTKAEFDTLKTQIEEVGLKVVKMQESGKPQKGRTLADAWGDAYKAMMFDKDDNFKMIKKSENRALEVKVVGTMTTDNITPVGTNSIPFTLSDAESGLTRIVRRMPFIIQLTNLGTTIKKFVQWAEQANPDDGQAAITGEAQGKHQTDFDIVEKSAEVRKITAYIKVSTEMLDDVDFMRSEINTELVELLKLKLDEQVLLGDGTGVNMDGIINQAEAFAAGTFADTIPDANEYDVLRVAINQVMVNLFQPSFIVLHPEDLTKMELEKDADNRYIIYPFNDKVGGVVKGVPIITNTGMTAGDFLVGDFMKSRVLMRKDVALSVGFENDDFTKNIVTILGEVRAVHYIKTNFLGAFVTGDFATAKVDLDDVLT